tara:strand:+ start:2386 stop:3879 length:1494 start_codon:yes stop_codon:yes gene_type:complete
MNFFFKNNKSLKKKLNKKLKKSKKKPKSLRRNKIRNKISRNNGNKREYSMELNSVNDIFQKKINESLRKKKGKIPKLNMVKKTSKVGATSLKLSNISEIKKITCNIVDKLKKQNSTKHLGSGVTNRVDLVCLDDKCTYKAAFRFMPISKDYYIGGTMTDSHPVEVERRLLEELTKLNNPHFIKLYSNLQCDYTTVIDEGNEMYLEYNKKVENNEISRQLNIMILELANKGTINNYIKDKMLEAANKTNKKNKNEVYQKIINAFFQILYAISWGQINIKYFKHGDLHANNVVSGDFTNKIMVGGSKQETYIKYYILGKIFYIPYDGNCWKIIDFDTFYGKDYDNNKLKVDTVYEENGVILENQPGFDSHLIFNSCLGDYMSGKNDTFKDTPLGFFYKHYDDEYIGDNEETIGFKRIKDYSSFITCAIKDYGKCKKMTSAIKLLDDEIFHQFIGEEDDARNENVIHTIDGTNGIPKISELVKTHPHIFTPKELEVEKTK